MKKMLPRNEMKEISDKRYDELLTKLDDQPPKVKDDFKNVPKSYQRLYLEVHCSGEKSFTNSIKLKCLDCCCWQREEITHCTVRQCGLWAIRPYQEKTLTK